MSLKIFINSMRKGEMLLPILRKHLAKEAQDEASGKISHKDLVVKDAERTIRCFKARKEEYNHREQLEGDYFHPSQIGGCLRAMFYAEFEAPRDNTQNGADYLRSHLVFEVGTYFHVLFQNLCQRAGVLVSREIAIQDKPNKHLGHADGIIRIAGDKYLLEIKTINGRGFASLKEVKEAHKQQTHAYMKSLNLKGCIVIYYNKETSELKEYFIAYSNKFYIEKVANRIAAYFGYKRRKQLPPSEGGSPYRMPCTYCDFKKICFDKARSLAWVKKL